MKRHEMTLYGRMLPTARPSGMWRGVVMSLVVAGLTGCSIIDEDLSDCVEEEKEEVTYELTLVTNFTTEIETKLNPETDKDIAEVLREHLSRIFTDFAHDVDLSFYDTQGDSVRLHHDQHIMDANQATYTLTLPRHNYMHLAVANILDNQLVNLADDGRCHPSQLRQTERDTIDSHTTGLFTARQPMNVLEGVNQKFEVRLYMANCAAALLLDPRNSQQMDNIRVYSTGFATGFNICDSTFQYVQEPPLVRTATLVGKESGQRCYCSVNFPSKRETAPTRTIIETLEPFLAQPSEEALWEFRVYVPQDDGTITETILRIKEPLSAGQLKIIKCWIGEHGAVITKNSEVSTSVTLDWKEGLHIET